MNIRPKTIRRLIALSITLALIVGVGMGIFFYHRNNKAKKLAQLREEGFTAYTAGDYPAALDRLKGYVAKNRDDFDAVFAYAFSRSRVEMPGFKHLVEAIGIFDQLLIEKPGHLPTQHVLLDLYGEGQRWPETVALADSVLSKDPSDAKALRRKGEALAATGKIRDSLVCFEKLADATPTDLDAQLTVRDLMLRTRAASPQIVARYQKLLENHKDDPRFEMLLAVAYFDANNAAEGEKLLRAAAARPAPDAGFVQKMARIFDQLKLFDEGQALLEKSAVGNDPKILRVLVQRLWQNGRYGDVVSRLTAVNAGDAQADTDLLALKSLSLFAMDKPEEARALVETLASRKTDSAAQAWATAIKLRHDNSPDDVNVITKYLGALSRDKDNAIIQSWIGEAYFGMGEIDLAIGAWQSAATALPSWAGPLVAMSRAQLMLGRTDAAVESARDAFQRAPTLPSTNIVAALTSFAQLEENPNGIEQKRLAAAVARIQSLIPGEPETLPIHIVLLSRAGQKDQAVAALRAAIAEKEKVGIDALSKLMSVDRVESLGASGEILERMKSLAASSPRAALITCMEIARSGDKDGAKKLIRSLADSATTNIPAWQQANAQILELVADPAAADAWIALGDAHPGDMGVQATILRAAISARSNRDFLNRTIDRVRKITGDDGALWRLAKARALLMNSPSDRDSSEAVALLSELVRAQDAVAEYRLLLAAGLMNLKNSAAAVEHLRAAVNLDPRNLTAALDLHDLLRSQGKFDEAGKFLDRLVRARSLPPAIRREVASRLIDRGNTQGAADLLQAGESTLDASGRLLFAELLRKRGDASGAEKVYVALLAESEVSASAVASAADFYASRGNADRAKEVLAKLDSASYSVATRELVRAGFADAHETEANAILHFTAAIAAEPNNAQAWTSFVQFYLRRGKTAEAIATAESGLKNLPDNASLVTLKLQAAAVQSSRSGGEMDVAPLIEALAKDPRNAAQVEMLRAVQSSNATSRPSEQSVTQLRQAADRYPGYLPLQVMLTRGLATAGRLDDAATVAERAMQSRPNDPAAAQLAASVYQQAQRWRDMRRAAEKWRERSLDDTTQPDAAIGVALLNLNDAAGALKQVESMLEKAKADPDRATVVLSVGARSLARLKRTDEAASLLRPLLDRAAVRSIWATTAATDIAEIAVATQWLNDLAAKVPPDATAERLSLARSRHELGLRLSDPASLEAARTELKALTDRADAPADAWFYFGSITQQIGDPAAAESHYRNALKIDANHAEAMNDLAYLLLQRNANLAEAGDLAQKASTLRPGDANILDTLGRVRAKQNNRAAAIGAFNAALRIDPTNLDALVALATVLHADGQRTQAADALRRLDALVSGNQVNDERLKSEIKSLRDAIASPAPK